MAPAAAGPDRQTAAQMTQEAPQRPPPDVLLCLTFVAVVGSSCRLVPFLSTDRLVRFFVGPFVLVVGVVRAGAGRRDLRCPLRSVVCGAAPPCRTGTAPGQAAGAPTRRVRWWSPAASHRGPPTAPRAPRPDGTGGSGAARGTFRRTRGPPTVPPAERRGAARWRRLPGSWRAGAARPTAWPVPRPSRRAPQRPVVAAVSSGTSWRRPWWSGSRPPRPAAGAPGSAAPGARPVKPRRRGGRTVAVLLGLLNLAPRLL